MMDSMRARSWLRASLLATSAGLVSLANAAPQAASEPEMPAAPGTPPETPVATGPRTEQKNLTELRNTVVNLLQALVERGVVTRDQAAAMVRDAQSRAQADANAAAAQEKAEEGAVRVPYVPQIVKDEIRRQVMQELAPEVTKQVVEQAQSEQWGVPAALPDWIQRMRFTGDLRVRAQGDMFASDNLRNSYQDILTINDRGGTTRAGVAANANTTEDRQRLRARLRFGMESELGYGWSAAFRLATGNLRDAVSTNQTLGNYGGRFTLGVDQAYLRWDGQSDSVRHVGQFTAGRMTNPFLSTDLVWDADVNFDGVAGSYRLGLKRDEAFNHFAYVTLGAFPIQEVELSTRDKWLLAGQMGIDYQFARGHRLRAAAAYYDFTNISGRRNTLDSTLLDYTAPVFLQRGNSMFNIRNFTDPTAQLFALMSDYQEADITVIYDHKISPLYKLSVTADYVKNLGFDAAKIRARTGFTIPKRTQGYQMELAFGSANMARAGAWRAIAGYRYLQADAVVDAFTDSDFRLGGTDVKGFTITGEYALTPRVLLRGRYLSGDAIDGAPFGVDLFQFDLNAQF
jgi:polyhydroxyalkanoate synthesis regulator phasin